VEKLSSLGTAVAVVVLASLAVPACAQKPAPALTPDEVQATSQEAILYGLPLVMLYSIMNEYAINKDSDQFKAPFNQIKNEPRVYTPADTAVITPNSDTPYSFAWLDLRAEPVVLCVPQMSEDRYYSVMLTSQYTFNFGYIGSRATGNGAGCYAIAGPGWTGSTPKGIDKVFVAGTDFALATYRTQLFNPADIDNVKAIQGKYSAQTLSAFLGQPTPAPAPEIDWPGISKATEKADPFSYLAFILQFAPATGPAAVEVPLREKFARIGIEAGELFPTVALTAADKAAMKAGIQQAEPLIKAKIATLGEQVNGWVNSHSMRLDRSGYGGDWTGRSAVAVAGILANDAVEASYAFTRNDKDGVKLDGSTTNYTLTFPAGDLPPVNAFWSVTMYDGNTQLLIENPINRYLINSPMLPELTKNADGSLTLYIQRDAPTDPSQKANWLPAPNGPVYIVLRMYWPKEQVLNGQWEPPGIQAAK
jgi:hypothetical protein